MVTSVTALTASAVLLLSGIAHADSLHHRGLGFAKHQAAGGLAALSSNHILAARRSPLSLHLRKVIPPR